MTYDKSPKLPPPPWWMEEDWARDHKIKRFTLRPYNLKETLRWVVSHIVGPSKKYKSLTEFIPREMTLNKITPEYHIGFVGDIMKMFGHDLLFDDSLFDFFNDDVQLIVGNLEGILTLQPGTVLSQRHDREIMEQLSILKHPKKWLLCLSNNHSGDFGFADFIFHLDQLRTMNFNVFGRKDVPNFVYKDTLNFVSGTMWSNQDGAQYMTRFEDVDEYFIDDGNIFNILYPHWHYEYELYPRESIVKECQEDIKGWDLIFGHHPHVVQPITKVEHNGINKVLAYSGGNFCSGLFKNPHEYGLIMKCEIGYLKDDDDQLAVGDLEWQFVRCQKNNDYEAKMIKIVKKNKYFPNV